MPPAIVAVRASSSPMLSQPGKLVLTKGGPMNPQVIVLGGGGMVGLAWTLGWLSAADLPPYSNDFQPTVIGTSAGAIAGAAWLLGPDAVAGLLDGLVQAARTNPGTSDDETSSSELAFELCHSGDPAAVAAVGTAVLAEFGRTDTGLHSERMQQMFGDDWSAGDLRVVARDAESGERVVFTVSDNVPLSQAIAASSCVPGQGPAIKIGDRYFLDGGFGSSINADVACGLGSALVLAPGGLERSGRGSDPILTAADLTRLSSQATVDLVFPRPAIDLSNLANVPIAAAHGKASAQDHQLR